KGIVAQPEVGSVYEAKVKSVMPYGAFVEFLPGKQGLLHISEVSHKRLETMDGVLKEGDMVKVKLIGKVLMPKPEGAGQSAGHGGGHGHAKSPAGGHAEKQ